MSTDLYLGEYHLYAESMALSANIRLLYKNISTAKTKSHSKRTSMPGWSLEDREAYEKPRASLKFDEALGVTEPLPGE